MKLFAKASNNCTGRGWYSGEVIAYVLRWKVAQHALGTAARWKMENKPVQPNDESFLRIRDPSSLGIIVNEAGRHWTAVRWEHDNYWLLDSLRARPNRR